MVTQSPLDCILIGYNDVPFENYERLINTYGTDSEAYRDLQYSFFNLPNRKLIYPDMMNYVTHRAKNPGMKGDGMVTLPNYFTSGEIPNLAAAYLMNFLGRRGFRVDYINLFQQEKERFIELLEDDPLCVAITTTFYIINYPVNEMVQFIRRHNSKVKIIVGGPLIANHVRNYSGYELESALNDIEADIYVVEAQGELTLSRIVAALKNGGDLSKVPNLYYYVGGGIERTLGETERNSMDDEAINWQFLAEGKDLGPTLQTRTARSCAFSCAFCNYPTRAGKLALTSLETLEQEFDRMYSLENVKNVVFIDDTFNVPLPRFKDICRLMIRKNYGWNWFSYFRCSNSDEEAIELMARSGCKGVFLGIEAGSPQILLNMNKRATIEKYLTGIQRLNENGIITFGSFIAGFPGETAETAHETIDFINEGACDYYRVQLWYNEAGTPIHQLKDKYEIEGDGFVWSHATMDSMEAMDWIDRTFLQVQNSTWLPQWSFDFWIIPYLLGKGIREDQLKAYLKDAQEMLALEIAYIPEPQKVARQEDLLARMTDKAAAWKDLV